jgi:integrase
LHARNCGRFLGTCQTTGKPTKFSSILAYAWQLKKDGKAESTINTAILRLNRLARLTDIDDTEQVKATLATLQWKNNTKNNVAQIYTGYAKYINRTWTPPKFTEQNGLSFIPTEAEIDALISASKHLRTATRLQTLKETACRIGETEYLKWTDIDTERRTIHITAEKGSNSRILPISPKLMDMLNRLPRKNDKVFQITKHGFRETFRRLRNQTAEKLSNPRIRQIHLHTFRHWKATMEYHKTKDIIHVKTMLGHKSIESTMIYINLEQALFLAQTDEWTSKVAQDATQACQLIDAGFEYVTGEYNDGGKLFRKRK